MALARNDQAVDQAAAMQLASTIGGDSREPAEPDWLNRTRLNHPHLAEIAEQHGRMVEIAILAGEREHALQIVARAFDCLELNCIGVDSGTASILGERIACILDKAKIKTIGDLCKRNRNEILAIRHISWPTLRKIISALQMHGFDLKK